MPTGEILSSIIITKLGEKGALLLHRCHHGLTMPISDDPSIVTKVKYHTWNKLFGHHPIIYNREDLELRTVLQIIKKYK